MMRCAVVFLACLAAAVASAAEPAVLELQEDVHLTADLARLSDVAAITADEATATLLAAVPVQRLPDLSRREISADRIRALVRRHLPGVAVVIRGERASVMRQARQVGTDELHNAALTHLEARFPEGGDVQVDVVREAGAITVLADPQNPVTLLAEPLVAGMWGEVPYRIRVMRGSDELRRGMVIFRVQVVAEVPVAAHDLPRGKIVELDDLVLQRQLVERPDAAGGLPTLQSLVGLQTTSAVAAGNQVIAARVEQPPVVTAGNGVVMVVRQASFELTAPGIAVADGRVGDVVRIRRANGDIVMAQVLGPGEVLVNYR